MFEVIGNPEQKARWRAMVAGGAQDWDSLLEGYASCVDWPSAHYWRALIAAYPEAKIILTWRDPESWWQSFSNTILKGISTNDDPASVGRALIQQKVFDGRMADHDHAIAVYQTNVAAVLAEVPAGRLLVHRLGDGWPSLCAHLGVPVPDLPYPHGNTVEAFQARISEPGARS
jgi:hypothetical protein